MHELETTNPVEGEVLPSAEVTEENEAIDESASTGSARTESEGPAHDEFGNLVEEDEEPEEEPFEEIDRNGKKATIPAWLKPELMMQADYTRKTQELAEARRAFDAERQAMQQFTEAELSAFANL